jgi:hypothetical protein
MGEMAAFYSEVLQYPLLQSVFQKRLQDLAAIEGISPETLYEEIEAMASSPAIQRDLHEERKEAKEQEQRQLYLAFEPYLDSMGRDDRKVIESELIDRDLVNPLSLKEVAFSFHGQNRFLLGNEGIGGSGKGLTKVAMLGPGDGFAIGQVPVTELLYFVVALNIRGLDPTPSHFRGGDGTVVLHLKGKSYALRPNHPVQNVTYGSALMHARRASEKTGVLYEIPDELHWDFANRGGSETEYHFGDDARLLSRHAWFNQNSDKQTHAVGQLSPNAFHLYDTLGNVSEWTSSLHNGEQIIRGGHCLDFPQTMCSGFRWSASPSLHDLVGFRLLRRNLEDSCSPAHTFTFAEREPNLEVKPISRSSRALQRLYDSIKHRWSVFLEKEE